MAQTPEVQALMFDVRQQLSDAYTFVQGQQAVKSFAAVTMEELMDQQITRITGVDAAGTTVTTSTRPSELQRLENLSQQLTAAVGQVKQLPLGAAEEVDTTDSVNSTE